MTDRLPPLDQLRVAEVRAVGASQTVKAIQRGRALLVVVARDADRKVTEPVIRAAQEHGVLLAEVNSGRELGRACGIAVGAAAAAVLGPATPAQ